MSFATLHHALFSLPCFWTPFFHPTNALPPYFPIFMCVHERMCVCIQIHGHRSYPGGHCCCALMIKMAMSHSDGGLQDSSPSSRSYSLPPSSSVMLPEPQKWFRCPAVLVCFLLLWKTLCMTKAPGRREGFASSLISTSWYIIETIQGRNSGRNLETRTEAEIMK